MDTFSHVPPGFRFHPTDEELVDYYLRKKVGARRIDLDVIKDIDLYKIEPWDLQEKCKIGVEEQNDWYFFSHKDKKYPTGTRTNRATTAGFWKATGRDKPIYSKNILVGMRKTLVFYKGRAPNGQKSDWIMHEYRLETNDISTPQEEGWVVCRVFKKRVAAIRRPNEHESTSWFDDQVSFMSDIDSLRRIVPHSDMAYNQHHYSFKPEHESHHHKAHDSFLLLPPLESPRLSNYHNQGSTLQSSIILQDHEPMPLVHQLQVISVYQNNESVDQSVEHAADWRVLDKFVASQLSQDHVSKVPKFSSLTNAFRVSDKQELSVECASTSTPSGQIDLWK